MEGGRRQLGAPRPCIQTTSLARCSTWKSFFSRYWGAPPRRPYTTTVAYGRAVDAPRYKRADFPAAGRQTQQYPFGCHPQKQQVHRGVKGAPRLQVYQCPSNHIDVPCKEQPFREATQAMNEQFFCLCQG